MTFEELVAAARTDAPVDREIFNRLDALTAHLDSLTGLRGEQGTYGDYQYGVSLSFGLNSQYLQTNCAAVPRYQIDIWIATRAPIVSFTIAAIESTDGMQTPRGLTTNEMGKLEPIARQLCEATSSFWGAEMVEAQVLDQTVPDEENPVYGGPINLRAFLFSPY